MEIWYFTRRWWVNRLNSLRLFWICITPWVWRHHRQISNNLRGCPAVLWRRPRWWNLSGNSLESAQYCLSPSPVASKAPRRDEQILWTSGRVDPPRLRKNVETFQTWWKSQRSWEEPETKCCRVLVTTDLNLSNRLMSTKETKSSPP